MLMTGEGKYGRNKPRTYDLRGLIMPDYPSSLIEFQRRFADEAACAQYLAAQRWPDGFRCPACGHDHAWALKTKPWTYECRSCRRQTSVKAGTVLHGSKLALTVWFWAAYLMATHSNGISALQLHQQLGLGSYKSAWLLAAKLRHAMVAPERSLLSGLAEIDETTIAHRTKNDPPAGGQGRSHDGKLLIVGAVEVFNQGPKSCPGRVRLAPIKDFSAESLHGFMTDNIMPKSIAKTDGWTGYPGAPEITHKPHVIGNMAAHIVLPWIHRVFANLKTWAHGVYHGLRAKHLQSYLDEFVFRFNRRKTRHAAFRSLLGIATRLKPITYNMLISPEPKG
jgi:transposase-like protein